MKKFNFKLLMVTVMVLVLLVSLIACNPKEKTPENPPSNTNNSPYAEPIDANNPTDVFFTELYNITHDIGSEKIEANQNVYVEADLGIELGNRAEGYVDADGQHKSNISVKLQALLDRAGDGANTQLGLSLSIGKTPLVYLCYVPGDKSVYAQVGSQKVKINTELISVGTLIDSLISNDIVKDGANLGSVDAFLNEALGKGENWSLDNFISALVNQFKLADQMKGLVSALPGGIGNQFLDRNGALSVRRLLGNDIVQSLFTATKSAADGEGYETHTAKLATDGDSLIGGMLGTGENVGDLDVAISFKSKNHSVKDGVTISADFDVDENNAIYSSLKTVDVEGADPVVLHPYLELNINHLKVRKAGTSSIDLLVSDEAKADYKENLQLDVNETIEISGIKIGNATTGSKPPLKIELRVLADLDLKTPGKDNKTKFHISLNQYVEEYQQQIESRQQDEKYNTTIRYKDLQRYWEPIFDFQYVDHRFTYTFNPSADLIRGYFGWSGIIHDPVGNIVKGILEKTSRPELAETFLERYNHQAAGSGMSSSVYDFEGVVIDNVYFDDILKVLVGIDTTPATAADESSEAEEAEPVKSYNMFNGIVSIFSLLNKTGEGKLNISVHGLMDLVLDIMGNFGMTTVPGSSVALTEETLFPYLKGLIDGFNGMITSHGILQFDGCPPVASNDQSFINRLKYLFDATNPEDNNLTFTTDIANGEGMLWSLDLVLQKNDTYDVVYADNVPANFGQGEFQTAEYHKVTDKGVADIAIKYTSSIKFNTEHVEISNENRLDGLDFDNMFEKKAIYEAGIEKAQEELDQATEAAKAPNATYEEKKAAYEATDEYKTYAAAQETYTATKTATTDTVNVYRTASMWYTNTIGKSVSNIYSQNSTSNTTKPLYKWITEDKKVKSGANWEKIVTTLDAAMAALETNKDKVGAAYELFKGAWGDYKTGEGGDLWKAYVAECEALIAQNDAKAKAEDKDNFAPYKEYKDAETAKKAADGVVAQKQAAVDALEDPYFVYLYWDVRPTPAE